MARVCPKCGKKAMRMVIPNAKLNGLMNRGSDTLACYECRECGHQDGRITGRMVDDDVRRATEKDRIAPKGWDA